MQNPQYIHHFSHRTLIFQTVAKCPQHEPVTHSSLWEPRWHFCAIVGSLWVSLWTLAHLGINGLRRADALQTANGLRTRSENMPTIGVGLPAPAVSLRRNTRELVFVEPPWLRGTTGCAAEGILCGSHVFGTWEPHM